MLRRKLNITSDEFILKIFYKFTLNFNTKPNQEDQLEFVHSKLGNLEHKSF
jgi:hypothetical protein